MFVLGTEVAKTSKLYEQSHLQENLSLEHQAVLQAEEGQTLSRASLRLGKARDVTHDGQTRIHLTWG